MISAPDDDDQPPFSIRDYVYAARHKHIENNWPFSLHHFPHHHHLINSLLPPFEPPDSVRKLCIPRKDQPHTASNHNSLTLSDHSVQNQVPQSPPDPHKNKTAVEPHPKCRFIMRFGSASNHPTRTEDIATSSTPTATSTISDSMASNVCPVCQTFSSLSNNTLNAHIDQCLSVQPTSRQLTSRTELANHIINPIKKRSMVDIYATALPCTLEELDRRNGSNWAANSSLSPMVTNVIAEEQGQRLSGAVQHKHAYDEGPVYFDSNGTKLRIISAFSNESIAPPRDEPSRGCKVILNNVKQHFPTKNAKTVRPKARHRPLCSPKTNENEIFGAQGITCGMEKSSDKSDGNEDSEPRPLQRWACSKRRHRLKRISGKDNYPGVGYSSHLSMKSSISKNKRNFDNSLLQDTFPTRSPSNYAASYASNLYTDSPLHESQVTDAQVDSYSGPESEKNLLTNVGTSSPKSSCLVKLPTCIGMVTTSPRSTRVEASDHTAGSSVSFDKDHESPLSTEWIVKPSLSKMMSELIGQQPSLKKPRMCRLRTETELQVGIWPLDSQHDSVSGAENLRQRYWKGTTCSSDGSSYKLTPEVEEMNDQLSFAGLGALTSRRGREASVFTEWGKPTASSSGAENRYPDVNAESRVGASFSKLYGTACMDNCDSQEKGSEEVPVTKTFSTKTFASDFRYCPDSLDSQTKNSQSTGEHTSYVWETEEPVSFVQPKLLDAQGENRANEVCRIKEVRDMASELNSQVAGLSSFEGKWSAPAPPGSALPNLRDMNSEDLHENSSLTSSNIVFTQDRHRLVDRHSSESPVSAISNISPHSIRSDSQFSDPELRGRPCAVQDRLIPRFSGGPTEPGVVEACNSPLMGSQRAKRINLERENFGVSVINPPEEPVEVIEDQPCCCKWKKSLSSNTAPVYQAPNLSKELTWESSLLHSKGKPMVYGTNIQPEYFMEHDFVPLSGYSMRVIPSCEPSRGVFSKHSSSEVVQRLKSHSDSRNRCTYSQDKNNKPTPNPVLRLMGKNLMVVNQEVDTLRQPTPDSADTLARRENMNLLKDSASSTSNQECAFIYFGGSQGSVVPNQDSSNPQPLLKDDISKIFRSHSRPTAHQGQPIDGNIINNVSMGGVDSTWMWPTVNY